jgi:SHAQKYF class myb-like DNA-binding protein
MPSIFVPTNDMSSFPAPEQPTDNQLPAPDIPFPESVTLPDHNVPPSDQEDEQAISDAIDEAVAALPDPDGIDVDEAVAASNDDFPLPMPASVIPQPQIESTTAPSPGRVCPMGQEQTGRWTREEQERFIEGLERYGKEWKKVAAFVETRTIVQVRTHAQKFQKKLAKIFDKPEGEVSVSDFNGATESVGGRMRLRVGEEELKRFERLHVLFSTTHGGYGKN